MTSHGFNFNTVPIKQSYLEAALLMCSYTKLFWKYAANLQENTHAEVRFQ